ncbi:MAG: hypothetical protein HKN28_19570 [Alphaproteobacteria bacterium]|nr:hypothetical protein [Alphaproteobacteria bacterium]
MSRKVIYSISALLLVFEIGLSAIVVNSGERQISASLAGIGTLAAQVREYSRPLPKLESLL